MGYRHSGSHLPHQPRYVLICFNSMPRSGHAHVNLNLTSGVALRTFVPVEGFDELERRLDGVDICLSVALNVVITVMISIRLLRANKRLVNAFPLLKKTVHINVISILVESAAPVAVFGIGTVTASFIDTVAAAKAGAVIQVFYKVAAV